MHKRNICFIFAVNRICWARVDFIRPVQAVIPGVQGRILAVLAETTAELNIRTIARLAGVSVAQASRVLPTLVDLGIVDRREAPPSAQFWLVPDNVAATAVLELTRARQTVVEELGRRAGDLNPRPTSVLLFGSFARGEADALSDLDAVVVRAARVEEENSSWRSGLEDWREGARRLTGNRVELVEVSEREIRRLLRGRRPLWSDVRRDGIVVFGESFAELGDRHRA